MQQVLGTLRGDVHHDDGTKSHGAQALQHPHWPENKKGIDLEAAEIEDFELVWDPDAPARCRGCRGAVAGKRAGLTPTYCNEECRLGRMKITCKKCNGPAVVNEWLTCKPCDTKVLTLPEMVESSLSRSLKRDHEFLRNANNFWNFQREMGEEPATKRKRT
jgi:hypothetical protein